MELEVCIQNMKNKKQAWFSLPEKEEKIRERLGLDEMSEYELVEYNFDYKIFDVIKGLKLSQLNRFAELVSEFSTIEDVIHALDDTSGLECATWCDFNEEFFDISFSSKMEAASATYFGNIRSWNDDYIRLNDYANLETTKEIDYDAEADEIFECFVAENI